MGPLVPFGIIGTEFNLIIALILGFFFGMILEQAGFSSSRKLVGIFYGYDFVVLKVFFTAAITAMIGLIFFNYLGWVDASYLYVNPLYLWPAIVGGAIMGIGFLLGGFCPGTSLTAAIIGRIDAMVFVGGILIGVFIFGESYGSIEQFYTSSAYGDIKVFESLGISRGFFALALIIIALIAFAVTESIEEKRWNKLQLNVTENQKSKSGFAAISLVALGLIILFIPEERQLKINEASPAEIVSEISSKERTMSPDELAFRIMHTSDKLKIMDVRPQEDYQEMSLPGAVHVPLNKLSSKSMIDYVNKTDDNDVIKVFYSNGSTRAGKAWMLLRRMGYEDFYILEGGLNNFVETIFQHDPWAKPVNPIQKSAIDQYRFRKEASEYFRESEGNAQSGSESKPDVQTIKVEGGC